MAAETFQEPLLHADLLALLDQDVLVDDDVLMSPITPPTASGQAIATARQLASRHLQVVAQSVADALEGRRQRPDPRVERSFDQTRRLAESMDDADLVERLDELRRRVERMTRATPAKRGFHAARLSRDLIRLGDLIGGDGGRELAAVCRRRTSLDPLAARLRGLKGIGDTRLTRLWDAGLLSLEALHDADPQELVKTVGVPRALANKLINAARDHIRERVEAAADSLEEAAFEVAELADSRPDDPALRARLGRSLDKVAAICGIAPTTASPASAHHPARTTPTRPQLDDVYTFVAPLGRGSEAEVAHAIQVDRASIRRSVAVKYLLAEHADDPDKRLTLETEARLLARLNHANIVSFIQLAETNDGQPLLALELLPGIDLHRFLARATRIGHPMPASLAVNLGLCLADALAAVHREHVNGAPLAHGDVAPSNIMLCPDGRIKLIDFGLAARQALGILPNGIRGRLGYLAPELLGAPTFPTPRADQFALATVMWEAMTLKRLFLDRDPQQTIDNTLAWRVDERFARHPHVHVDLLRILRRALARDPALRFESMDAFAAALSGWRDQNRCEGVESVKRMWTRFDASRNSDVDESAYAVA